MAGEWVMALNESQSAIHIDESMRQLVMLAGLFHDIGHGPFSHLFENVVMPSMGRRFDHESMCVGLVHQVAQSIGLSTHEANSIISLIQGEHPTQWPRRYAFVSQIVHNNQSVLDVDKLDYYMRDALCCFGKHVAEVRPKRLFYATRPMNRHDDGVAGGNEPTTELAFANKVATTLRDLCFLRAKLHRTVYQHPVVLRAGHMIGDVIATAARDDPQIANLFGPLGLHAATMESQCDALMRCGDWIFDAICASTSAGTAKARKIADSLHRRQLYPIAKIIPLRGSVEECNRHLLPIRQFICHDVATRTGRSHTSVVDHTSVDPLSKMRFFNPKRHNEHESVPKAHFEADVLSPARFQECEHVVFTRDSTMCDAIRVAATRAVYERSIDTCERLPNSNTR